MNFFEAFELYGRPIGRSERGTKWERLAGAGRGTRGRDAEEIKRILDRILPQRPFPEPAPEAPARPPVLDPDGEPI